MRLFEILTLVTLLLALVTRFWAMEKRPFWSNYLPGMAILLILIHLIIERYRWQMVPAYVLAASLFLMSLLGPRQKPSVPVSKAKRTLSIVGMVCGLVLLILATAVSILMPVFKLPQPSGPYAVGSTSFRLVDTNREEILTAEPSDNRELLVQVWYPAEPVADTNVSPYWENAHIYGSLLADFLGMPPFLFEHLALVQTHTYPQAPIATGAPSYPVLVFSHGYVGLVSQNTVQMEELASHGYVVFSIAHTYETLVSVYPDGDIVPYSDDHCTAFLEEIKETSPLWEPMTEEGTNTAEKEELVRQLWEASPLMEESISIWTDDTIFVLDELERLNAKDSIFVGRLDLSKLGVFGMSFGGATAGQVCLVDSRCRAGINMDGLQYGDIPDDGIVSRPFMVMYGDESEGINDFLYERITDTAYSVTVAGARHFNYSDFGLFSPVFKMAGFVGPIDGERMAEITSAYTLAFFDKHLKGEDVSLLEGPSSDYPEVTVEIRNP